MLDIPDASDGACDAVLSMSVMASRRLIDQRNRILDPRIPTAFPTPESMIRNNGPTTRYQKPNDWKPWLIPCVQRIDAVLRVRRREETKERC